MEHMRYSIGLDIGIASTGYAVMELSDDDRPCRIIRIGARVFDKPEHEKGESPAKHRREARGQRRRLRRRSYRKSRIRNLIIKNGLMNQQELDGLFEGKQLSDIYKLRCEALDRQLSNEEFTRVLIHLSQRRGFKSNRKTDKSSKDDGKLLTAIKENKDFMENNGYRTVGEMFLKDSRYDAHKRNKADNYLNTVSRDMVRDETEKIFDTQRNFGNFNASQEFENEYVNILFGQRSFDEGPGGKSPYAVNFEEMVGFCTFEKDQKRAPKAAYSFELYNLLLNINHMRIEGNPLTPEQRKIIIELAHKSQELNYTEIRKQLDLPYNQRFNKVIYIDKNMEDDIIQAESKTKFEYLNAYHEMREALDKVSKDYIKEIPVNIRNEIARIFSLYKTEENIDAALNKTDLNESDKKVLKEHLGTFEKFCHLSIKVLDKIIPHLQEGMNYYQAVEAAGYDSKGHNKEQKSKLISLKDLAEETENTITSPVVRRSLSQCAKVINAIIREMGTSPVYINIELAREMSKDYDERKKLEKAMNDNQEYNTKIRNEIKEMGNFEPRGLDIVKLRLWKQQDGRCPYSSELIKQERLFEPGYAEVDHIIPYSISFNDTYNNKVCVLAEENRQKGNLLPLQYLKGEKRDKFKTWVNSQHLPKHKKYALLKEEIEDEEGFKQRNLQDTQLISRFMYNYLTDNLLFNDFKTGRKKTVTAVNGAVTSLMRKRLGLVKLREDGDKHHAIDAAVIACTTDGMIREITNYSKFKETRFQNPNTSLGQDEVFPPPYPDFDRDLERNLKQIFVSRAPTRKITGAAHKATIQAFVEPGKLVKRVPLTSLKLDKDGEIDGYFNKECDMLLYNAIKERLSNAEKTTLKKLKEKNSEFAKRVAEKAFAEPLYKPINGGTNGHLVKKVKIIEKSTLNVSVHGGKGRADNDSMVRTDVFYVDGKYYLVPIYVADTLKEQLPNKAIVAAKPYEEWAEMDDKDFIFSLYPNDLILLKHKKTLPLNININSVNGSLPKKIEKKEEYFYYKNVDISSGAIKAITHDSAYYFRGGAKTLLSFEKWQVDVLGNISKVTHEPRKGF